MSEAASKNTRAAKLPCVLPVQMSHTSLKDMNSSVFQCNYEKQKRGGNPRIQKQYYGAPEKYIQVLLKALGWK